MDESELLKTEKTGFFKRHFGILSDIWGFLKVRKRWWLVPLIVMLVLMGLLILFGQATPLSPFIYALF